MNLKATLCVALFLLHFTPPTHLNWYVLLTSSVLYSRPSSVKRQWKRCSTVWLTGLIHWLANRCM